MDDRAFLDEVADALAGLPNVEAVALGGSRAYGTPGPESDWDFSIYYRGAFEPDALRALGWPGEVSEIGAWGGGVFNGGAWLTHRGRKVDVHYRDLGVVERVQREAMDGVLQIEPLMFHLAGIPTYLLLAELAEGRCLRGELPRPSFPPILRESAGREWWSRSTMLFDYAESGFAAKGQALQTIGMIAEAVTCAAHAILAARGTWVTNEKRILALAGLEAVDGLLQTHVRAGEDMPAVLREVRRLCTRQVEASPG